jgi:hypothetical protein
MFKARESMRTTINYLQDENKELKATLKEVKFNGEEYEKLKNRYERVLNVLFNIKELAIQNTYGKTEVKLAKIRELLSDANLTK